MACEYLSSSARQSDRRKRKRESLTYINCYADSTLTTVAIDERRKTAVHAEGILYIAHRYIAIEIQSSVLRPVDGSRITCALRPSRFENGATDPIGIDLTKRTLHQINIPFKGISF